MASGPRVRASWTSLLLRALEELEPTLHAALKEAEPESFTAVADAGALTFLPAEHHAALFRHVADSLGDDGYRSFFRAAAPRVTGHPLLAPLIGGGVRVFGRNPARLTRISVSFWSLVFRECGTIEVVETADNHARLRADDVPEILRGRFMWFGITAMLETALALIDRHGRAEVIAVEGGTARFHLAW